MVCVLGCLHDINKKWPKYEFKTVFGKKLLLMRRDASEQSILWTNYQSVSFFFKRFLRQGGKPQIFVVLVHFLAQPLLKTQPLRPPKSILSLNQNSDHLSLDSCFFKLAWKKEKQTRRRELLYYNKTRKIFWLSAALLAFSGGAAVYDDDKDTARSP